MNNNKELKIYEFLGIKYFKKFMLKFHKLLYWPISLLLEKEQRRELYNNARDNYKIGKVSELKDIKTFKRNLYFNGSIHLILTLLNALIFISPLSPVMFILNLASLLINTYCVMLQRYNCIRINNMLSRCEPIEKKKQEELQRKLQTDEFIERNINHKILNFKKVTEKEITFEEFLNTASLSQIKEYMVYLRKLKDDSLQELLPLSKNEVLQMTLKREKSYK